MSKELALQALAEGDAFLHKGDHAAAIERFEAAASHFVKAERHMQAVSTYRRIFGLDMLRREAPAALVEILDGLGKHGCRKVWQEHLDKLPELKEKWPFRTATSRLATVDFDEEGREGFISYLEGSDPLARLGRVSASLVRCRREAEFAFVSDIMLANIVATSITEWCHGREDAKVELELMGTKRTFLLSMSGELTLADSKNSRTPSSRDEKLLTLLYEADLLATFGMSESARNKYEAVLEFDPQNDRAKSALVRIDDALAADFAKEMAPTDVGPLPPTERRDKKPQDASKTSKKKKK